MQTIKQANTQTCKQANMQTRKESNTQTSKQATQNKQTKQTQNKTQHTQYITTQKHNKQRNNQQYKNTKKWGGTKSHNPKSIIQKSNNPKSKIQSRAPVSRPKDLWWASSPGWGHAGIICIVREDFKLVRRSEDASLQLVTISGGTTANCLGFPSSPGQPGQWPKGHPKG